MELGDCFAAILIEFLLHQNWKDFNTMPLFVNLETYNNWSAQCVIQFWGHPCDTIPGGLLFACSRALS